jgi:aminotransferase
VLCAALHAAGMTYYEPGGSYFLWCDYSGVSEEDDTVFNERLLREAGVAAVPGSVFFPDCTTNPKRVRFTFSKSKATIAAAAERLAAFR